MARRMFLSYVSLLILPVCIILLVLFPQMRQTMIDNALMGKANNVARLSATLELHLSEMISSAIEMGQNARLTPYAILKTADGEYRAWQEIQKSKTPSTIVSDYFYYLKENRRFYAYNGGVYPLSWFTDTTYGYCYERWTQAEMEKALDSVKHIEVRPLEPVKYPSVNKGAVITVMIPVPVNSLRPYGVLISWMDEAELTRLISPANADPYEYTLLFDTSGQCVFARGGEQAVLPAAALEGELPSEANGQGILEIEGRSFAYASAQTQGVSWRCVSLTAMEPLLADISAMRSSVLLIIALLLVCGSGIIIGAIRTQYLPIRSLADKAKEYASAAGQKNEFEAVHHALESLKQQTDSLQSRMEDSLPELRRQKLLDLIGGQFADLRAFNDSAKEVGLLLSLPVLSVALLHVEEKDPFEVQDYLEQIARNIPHGLEGYFLPAIDGQDVLFVSAGQTEQSALIYLTDICADLSATQKCIVRAALGTAVKDTTRLGLSYSEAFACLERMRMQGQTGVQRGMASMEAMLVPTARLYQIQRAIEMGEPKKIEEAVWALCEYLHTGYQRAQVIHACYLDALSALLRAMDPFGGAPEAYEALLHVSHYLQHEEMTLNLKNACAILAEKMQAGAQGKAEADIEQVKAYITSKCLQYDFTIQMAADQFGMSYSGFSHYFKRRAGISCKQFVDDFRTEQAVLRIMHTMKPLETIAQEVGFSNASAFIRFFKKNTGRTPGSYRNL